MRTPFNLLSGLAISQIVPGILVTGISYAAVTDPDGDWPNSVEVVVESTLDGNPLNEGDEVFNVRGSHRLFDGNLGLEASIGYAEPTSDLVASLGDAELLLLDFSAVWYVNKPDKTWPPRSRIKPEVIVFGGPGWASLRIPDANPSFPLPDASKDFFTVNAGVGVKLYRREGDEYATSSWYFRPEVRARWFAGDGGDVDWGVGLAFGYCFGRRPTFGSLTLKVEEGCESAAQYHADELVPALGSGKRSVQKNQQLSEESQDYRRYLEELRARVVICGDKCESLRSCLNENIVKLNDAISKLRPDRGGVD